MKVHSYAVVVGLASCLFAASVSAEDASLRFNGEVRDGPLQGTSLSATVFMMPRGTGFSREDDVNCRHVMRLGTSWSWRTGMRA